MRAIRRIVLLLVIAVLIPLLVFVAVWTQDSIEKCLPAQAADSGSLTVKGEKIEQDQLENAAIIAEVAVDNDLPTRAAIVAIATAIQESTLRNIEYGWPGSTSLGLFQQIEDWGSREDRLDPAKAAYMFYFGGHAGQAGLTDIPDWQDMSITEAAQAVQHSGFADAYAAHTEEATALANSVASYASNASISADAKCDPIEAAVRAALAQQGDEYSWNSGAGFASGSFATAGIILPDTSDELKNFAASTDGIVSGTWYDGDTVRAGEITLQRGDLVFTTPTKSSDQTSATIKDDMVSVYIGQEMPRAGGIRIATYNVHGSSHTAASGPESGASRMQDAAEVILTEEIDIVGLQEFQPDQRRTLMQLLGDEYDIWPKNAHYSDHGGAHSVNSIIWKTSVVERVPSSETSLPMPYYFGHIHRDIPLVKLQVVGTTTQFYALNTHDPAFTRNTKKRWLNALQHDSDVKRLHSEGIPVVLTGDLNSGYKVAKRANTYRGDRNNLAWCILGRGVMWDAYDATRPVPREEACSQETTREIGVGYIDHVLVTRDVSATNFTVVSKSRTASDHPVVYADFLMPGMAIEDASRPRPDGALGVVVGAKDFGKPIKLSYITGAEVVGVLRVQVSSTESATNISFNGKVAMPVPAGSYIDRNNYGDTGDSWEKYHTGNDYSAACGTSVFSATAGKIIIRTDQDWSGAWLVQVQTAPGQMTTWYAHMQALFVSNGDQVEAGQKIGEVGEMGNAFGCHLHFEVHPQGGGYAEDDIDPHDWFAKYFGQA